MQLLKIKGRVRKVKGGMPEWLKLDCGSSSPWHLEIDLSDGTGEFEPMPRAITEEDEIVVTVEFLGKPLGQEETCE